MADIMSKQARSRLMSKVRSRGNRSTEELLREHFRELGIRGWRRHALLEGCRPDFVFPRARLVIFADGCFWHGCPRHYTKPATRSAYWREKLAGNRARDKRNSARLRRQGWSVWRLWECRLVEIKLPARLLARLRTVAVGERAHLFSTPFAEFAAPGPAARANPRARAAAAPRGPKPRR